MSTIDEGNGGHGMNDGRGGPGGHGSHTMGMGVGAGMEGVHRPVGQRGAGGMGGARGVAWPAVVGCVAIAGVLAAGWRAARPPVTATPWVSQVQAGGQVRAAADGGASCVACHAAEVEAWGASPHARTLERAEGGVAERLAAAAPTGDRAGRFVPHDGRVALESPGVAGPVPVDWIFGSGIHARTPVSTWLDPAGRTVMLEHALSWYPPGFLAPTLGTGAAHPGPGLEGCGTLLDPATTRACFGCHATHVPTVDGRVDEVAVVGGVGCARCHPDGDRHAAAMHAGVADPTAGAWRRLTPLESIRACGECHRRDDQLTPDEIRPDNRLLVRFAPVGLAQSACFTRQTDRRLDCMTCHDPHVSADRRPLATTERCVSCHGDAAPHAGCPAAPATSDCTTCHMPKVEVQPHLRFTDHWIRVPVAAGAAPAR
jgi:predicted CXXCH cytochrome family protein